MARTTSSSEFPSTYSIHSPIGNSKFDRVKIFQLSEYSSLNLLLQAGEGIEQAKENPWDKVVRPHAKVERRRTMAQAELERSWAIEVTENEHRRLIGLAKIHYCNAIEVMELRRRQAEDRADLARRRIKLERDIIHLNALQNMLRWIWSVRMEVFLSNYPKKYMVDNILYNF